MSYNANIPQHSEELYITDDTTRAEVIEFVRARLAAPAVLNDVVVFNFSSYSIDGSALVNAASDLDAGVYVVPYQVPGAWGYMVDALPAEVADATLLTYRAGESEYHEYENWRNAFEDSTRAALRETYEGLALGGQQ